MISLAEPPTEYVPRGRAIVKEHIINTNNGKSFHLPSESVLLQRLQNVNISEKQAFKEFWSIRDIYKPCNSDAPKNNKNSKGKDKNLSLKTTITNFGNEKASANVSDCQTDDESLGLETEVNELPKCVTNGVNINMYDYLLNSEEELYVKGHTAVWTKGILSGLFLYRIKL